MYCSSGTTCIAVYGVEVRFRCSRASMFMDQLPGPIIITAQMRHLPNHTAYLECGSFLGLDPKIAAHTFVYIGY